MNTKLGLTLVLVIVFLGASNVLAEISVGVKEGDWIEYPVEYTGTPPEDHDVIWARIEITDVQGPSVSVEITVEYADETRENITIILNLEAGQLGDDFIVPADLNSGNMIYDENVGNITISKVEERTCAGAVRTFTHATTSETSYYWDKATGVLVEGNSQFPEYTMNTIVDKTSIWQPQLFGLDPAVFYALVVGTVVVVIAVLAALVVRRRK
jgi:hypothetical protein